MIQTIRRSLTVKMVWNSCKLINGTILYETRSSIVMISKLIAKAITYDKSLPVVKDFYVLEISEVKIVKRNFKTNAVGNLKDYNQEVGDSVFGSIHAVVNIELYAKTFNLHFVDCDKNLIHAKYKTLSILSERILGITTSRVNFR